LSKKDDEERERQGTDKVKRLLRAKEVAGSAPYRSFATEHKRIVEFMFFVTGIVERTDEMARRLYRALHENEEHTDEYQRYTKEGQGTGKYLQLNIRCRRYPHPHKLTVKAGATLSVCKLRM
jgi:hypothetical protein